MTVEYGFRDSSADAYRVEIGAIQAAIFDVLGWCQMVCVWDTDPA
ncbi:hypothetical protein [Corynebacterium cystitidis]|nr:hypothetical protein [Corynebacterium cystitidis]